MCITQLSRSVMSSQNIYQCAYLPAANGAWGKVMFSRMFVCPQGDLPGRMPGGSASRGVCLEGVCQVGFAWGVCLGGLPEGYAYSVCPGDLPRGPAKGDCIQGGLSGVCLGRLPSGTT